MQKTILIILFFVIIFSSISSVKSQQLNASDFVYYSQKSSFITEYDVPVNDYGLKGITMDDLGDVWVYHSNNTSSKIFKFEKQSNQFTQYDIEGKTETNNMIINLAGGHMIYEDGHVWFTDSRTNSIGKLDPKTGKIELYKIPTIDSGPFGLAFEPDFNRLWFTELASNKLAMLDINSKEIIEYNLKENSGPTFIAFDKSGNMWITQSYSESIVRTNPENLVSKQPDFIEYSLPKPDTFSPFGIAIFENSGLERIVLSDHGSNRVIVSDIDSKLESYSSYWTSPSSVYPQTLPSQVVIDKSGNVYFAQHGGNKISKIDTTNTITEFEIPTGPLSTTVYLTTLNNEVWFAEVLANKIGVLDLTKYEPITIELSKEFLTFSDKQPQTLDIFITDTKSDLLDDDITISLEGMTHSGIKGIQYSVNPEKINLSNSSNTATLNMYLQKNSLSGFYDAVIKVSAQESNNKNMTVSILKPISISINDLKKEIISETQTDTSLNFDFIQNILIIIVVIAGLFLLYRRIKVKKNSI